MRCAYNVFMSRLFLIALLVLAVVCLLPFGGVAHAGAGHASHDLASCANCVGPASATAGAFLLAVLGWLITIGTERAPLVPARALFRPPRSR